MPGPPSPVVNIDPASAAANVNAALQLIGGQQTIAALNDGTVAGNAAGTIYAPLVALLLRQLNPDFARRGPGALILVAGPANPAWAYEYRWPNTLDALIIRELSPPFPLADPYDPPTVPFSIGADTQSGVFQNVIYSNQANARAVWTTSNVDETMWDSIFTWAFIQRIASPLAMALSGRPDFARELLQESQAFAQLAGFSDDSMIREG